MLVQSIVDIGLTRLVGARPAHVDVTRDFLLAVRPLPLVPEQVVLELQADAPADDALLMVLREARDAGFRIALDGFDGGEEALLGSREMVKLDGGRADADAVARLRASNVTLVADRVQTRDVHRACLELGFDAFQGAYFAEPEVLTGHPVPTYRLRALSMLAQGESTSFEQLERVIVEDPGLSLKLMKLANSAFFGGRQRVGSIRQALMALGSVAVRRWATLLVLAGVSDRPSHLLEHGLVRARLCELIASRGADADPDRAFTVGLLSVADACWASRCRCCSWTCRSTSARSARPSVAAAAVHARRAGTLYRSLYAPRRLLMWRAREDTAPMDALIEQDRRDAPCAAPTASSICRAAPGSPPPCAEPRGQPWTLSSVLPQWYCPSP